MKKAIIFNKLSEKAFLKLLHLLLGEKKKSQSVISIR